MPREVRFHTSKQRFCKERDTSFDCYIPLSDSRSPQPPANLPENGTGHNQRNCMVTSMNGEQGQRPFLEQAVWYIQPRVKEESKS